MNVILLTALPFNLNIDLNKILIINFVNPPANQTIIFIGNSNTVSNQILCNELRCFTATNG